MGFYLIFFVIIIFSEFQILYDWQRFIKVSHFVRRNFENFAMWHISQCFI